MLPVGWTFVHASNCVSYYDGTRVWYYLLSAEGPQFFTNIGGFGVGMLDQCVAGNWIGFYVFDNVGTWNQTFSFAYR